MGNATKKQIDALRTMGYNVPDNLSFEEARTLFDSHNNKPKFEAALALGAPVQKIPARIESKSYHLTPEQVRYNALDIVLRRYPQLETPALLREAEVVEKWMLE